LEITIEGWRAGGEERKEAASVPANQLPSLTAEQKSVARKMGIAEEDYARSAYAGKRNQERLLRKTQRFGEILENKVRSISENAEIERIRLVTIDHEYRIDLRVGEQRLIFRVPEEMVDDFIEGGSAEVGRSIERNLETVLSGRAA
jgi:hypothetical protein